MSDSTTFPSFLGGRVVVKVGDITQEAVDAVVNAANGTLLGGGGVDGAIHRAGGPAILDECRNLRATRYPDGLPTGGAVLTTAGRMPARHVIHTVGPVYGSGGPDKVEKLAQCYRNSLKHRRRGGLRHSGLSGHLHRHLRLPNGRGGCGIVPGHPGLATVPAPPSGRSGWCSFLLGDAQVFLRHQAFDTEKT